MLSEESDHFPVIKLQCPEVQEGDHGPFVEEPMRGGTGYCYLKDAFQKILSTHAANKPIQDGGEAKAPLWLNRLSGTN